MPPIPTIAEIDREIAELETWLAYLEQLALQHGVLNRVGRERIAQLEQQRADLELRQRPTPAELAPVVSGVSGANDYDDNGRGLHCCLACEDAAMREGRLGPLDRTLIVCPKCGNKRCPKASHHGNDCTGSNEPGQPGSTRSPQD